MSPVCIDLISTHGSGYTTGSRHVHGYELAAFHHQIRKIFPLSTLGIMASQIRTSSLCRQALVLCTLIRKRQYSAQMMIGSKLNRWSRHHDNNLNTWFIEPHGMAIWRNVNVAIQASNSMVGPGLNKREALLNGDKNCNDSVI